MFELFIPYTLNFELGVPALDVSCNDNGVVISFDISKVPLVAKLADVIAQGVLKSNCCISVEFIIYTLVPSELKAKSIIPTGQVNVDVDVAVLISLGVDSVYCVIVPAALFKTYITSPDAPATVIVVLGALKIYA